LRENKCDELITSVAISARIGNGPCTNNTGSGGAVKTGVTISGCDGHIVTVIVTSGSSGGIGGSGRTVLAVEGDIVREVDKEGLLCITDTDELVLSARVTAVISNGPCTKNIAIASSGEITISVSGGENITAVIVSSGGRTGDGHIIEVRGAFNGDVGGESDKDGGNTISKGDNLVTRNKVSASISDGPCTSDGIIASTDLSRVRAGDSDSIAVIGTGRSRSGETTSALESGVSREEGKGRIDIIDETNGLVDSVKVSASISGSKGTSDGTIAVITNRNIDICNGGSVASISGGGTSKGVDACIGSADELSVFGDVSDIGCGTINKGDALNRGCGRSATISDTEGTGNELVARSSGGDIRGSDGEGSAIISRGGSTKGIDRGIRAAFELDITRSSNKDRRVLIGDGNDVVTSTRVVAIITKGECTCQSTCASSSSCDLIACNWLSNVAIISK